MRTEAQNYFIGRRGNCAQAVAAAWTLAYGSAVVDPAALSSCGRGKAPEGLCGALYAACLCEPDHKDMIRASFSEHTGGHVSCRAIRENRAADCVSCVGIAAGLLEELHPGCTHEQE